MSNVTKLPTPFLSVFSAIVRGFCLATITLLTGGCAGVCKDFCDAPVIPEPTASPGASETLPEVSTPEVNAPLLDPPDLAKLPEGARAMISNRDMAPVFMSIPPREAAGVSALSVRNEVIAPLLRAAGFRAGATAFRIGTARACRRNALTSVAARRYWRMSMPATAASAATHST